MFRETSVSPPNHLSLCNTVVNNKPSLLKARKRGIENRHFGLLKKSFDSKQEGTYHFIFFGNRWLSKRCQKHSNKDPILRVNRWGFRFLEGWKRKSNFRFWRYSSGKGFEKGRKRSIFIGLWNCSTMRNCSVLNTMFNLQCARICLIRMMSEKNIKRTK